MLQKIKINKTYCGVCPLRAMEGEGLKPRYYLPCAWHSAVLSAPTVQGETLLCNPTGRQGNSIECSVDITYKIQFHLQHSYFHYGL